MLSLIHIDVYKRQSSGRVVAYVGTYNPHTKEVNIQVEVAQKYLDNGAQPTPRVAKLLKEAGVKMPKWVKDFDSSKSKTVRNAEKLRKNQPKEEVVEETPAKELVAEEAPAEAEAESAE